MIVDFFRTFLDLLNETLTAAIVIVAVSLLLYNLTRNIHNRVARTSAFVLACITGAYICDILISLNPTSGTHGAILRLQWISIALLPATMFHLSDALLATTGLPSRGRRRNAARLLYVVGACFTLLAALTDTVVYLAAINPPSLRASWGFGIYLLYFSIATISAFLNVQRARERCLTRATRRRMAYLQIAMITPPIGIFPFSVLLPIGGELSIEALVLVNIINIVVILMLLFLAYPLSFFGSRVPDRVVKLELLRFLMRGPGTGLLALTTIIYVSSASRIVGLLGSEFMPFAVVAVVLLWQWLTDLGLPYLEKRLIYNNDDYEQISKLQNLGARLLTRGDLLQLLEGLLATIRDYLQVKSAFIINFSAPEVVCVTGIDAQTLTNQLPELQTVAVSPVDSFTRWKDYWLTPLYSHRVNGNNGSAHLIGVLGIFSRGDQSDLTAEESQNFNLLARRVAQTLDDMLLQGEIYAALEGLLPQISSTRTRAAEVEYRPGRAGLKLTGWVADREEVIEQVRAALRQYWGGAGLNNSRLLELNIIQQTLSTYENNPIKTLRAVLQKAIDHQRPSGERKMWSPEWTIYNILDLRFIERHKVLDVAERLNMSEADFYRKQRVAIEAVADTLIDMEVANS